MYIIGQMGFPNFDTSTNLNLSFLKSNPHKKDVKKPFPAMEQLASSLIKIASCRRKEFLIRFLLANI